LPRTKWKCKHFLPEDDKKNFPIRFGQDEHTLTVANIWRDGTQKHTPESDLLQSSQTVHNIAAVTVLYCDM